MSRLTTVDHVLPPQRQDAERRPVRDFAEALARNGAGSSQDRAPAKPSDPARGAPIPSMPAPTSITAATVVPTAPNPSRIPNPAIAGASIPNGVPADEGAMTVGQTLLALTVSPVGMTETLQYARVFGIHLLPDCYLSEVAVRDMPGEEVMSAVHSVPEGSVYAAVPSTCTDLRTEPVAGGDCQLSLPYAVVALGEVTGGPDGNPAIETMPPSGVAAPCRASAIAWSERTLRITGEGGGHAVAWIRDYRLDRHEEEALVQAVLQEVRARGVTLGKIVVNGREAWVSREAI